MTEKLSQCQIQVTPVEDGFVIQAQAIDGARETARQIAGTVLQLREKLHKIVDRVYEPPKLPPAGEPIEDNPSGPAGTKSPA